MQFLKKRSAIKILKSKLFFGCTIPAFVLGLLILIYYLNIKDFAVFPNNQLFSYNFYTNNTADGYSQILYQSITDSIIKLEYKFSDKINSPYVGLNIGPKGSKSINLKHYNQLTIKLKGTEINGIGIALVTQNSFKKSETREILFYHIFKISSGNNKYNISINKFEVPDWWGENNRIENASTIKPDLKNLEAINVSSAFTPNTGITQSLEISSISFSRNNNRLITLILAVVFTFVLLVFTTLFAIESIRDNNHTITISYKPIENQNFETPKFDFIDFINKNYNNSQLTLNYITRETGVSQRKITIEIQNRYGCNLKTYINGLRLSESKRLLVETNLPMGEITYTVGFNNQTHFNRVFKSEMKLSPSEYRNKNRNKPIVN